MCVLLEMVGTGLRRASIWALLPLGGAIAALIAFTILNGSGGSHATAATHAPWAEYTERAPHVASQLRLIATPGNKAAQRSLGLPPDNDEATSPVKLPAGQGLPPLAPAQFAAPVAAYKGYSEQQLATMQGEVAQLTAALRSGDRARSRGAWRTAFARYLRLGAVYLEGPLADLNEAIDGIPGGVPGGVESAQFTGLHRIEYGLWTGQPPASLARWSTQLSADVRRMRAVLPKVSIDPLDYATRAHEILEDAVRDLLSGTDVPWSAEGVLGTYAGLQATQAVLNTLKPILNTTTIVQGYSAPEQRSSAAVDADLAGLNGVLRSLAAGNGGVMPTNRQLTQAQTEHLDGAVGQALEGLAQVPGMLETSAAPQTPRIPKSAQRTAS
jgi:iron uptake system EfeUOB component EfeO/EfeM